jgi:hypothetical protein
VPDASSGVSAAATCASTAATATIASETIIERIFSGSGVVCVVVCVCVVCAILIKGRFWAPPINPHGESIGLVSQTRILPTKEGPGTMPTPRLAAVCLLLVVACLSPNAASAKEQLAQVDEVVDATVHIAGDAEAEAGRRLLQRGARARAASMCVRGARGSHAMALLPSKDGRGEGREEQGRAERSCTLAEAVRLLEGVPRHDAPPARALSGHSWATPIHQHALNLRLPLAAPIRSGGSSAATRPSLSPLGLEKQAGAA